jgi:cytoskeletal protein CcmA (bactofilin family)
VTVANSEANTIVGESIVISGNVSGDEDLTVRGRVEGTLTLTKALVVEPSGVVKAEVHAKSCVVSGAVVGNVTAADCVEITKEGRMVGDIAARRVIIADGASFRGRIEMGEVDVEEGGRPAAARAPTRPEVKLSLAERPAAGARPPAPPVAIAMGAVKRKVVVRRK